MQAPVVGGNGDGPPAWAGRREAGKSTSDSMEAAAEFAWKIAERYRPGGIVSTREGWGDSYGIRAWEMDNEPESYLTNWGGQAGDYAEFVTLCAARICEADPEAVIIGPSVTDTEGNWVAQTLDAHGMAGSPFYRARGIPYSIGPSLDVVSFHIYEGMDTFFASRDRTVECKFLEIRDTFEAWEDVPGFEYARKQEYWHTEGSFDFGLSDLSGVEKASWYWQFMTRAFAAGMRKVCVMDAVPDERSAIHNYTALLPSPHPMLYAPNDLRVISGQVLAFRHPLGEHPRDGQIWVLWAADDTSGASVQVPVARQDITLLRHDGAAQVVHPDGHWLPLDLSGGANVSSTYLVVDAD
jgi:hypothetical protein